MRSASGIGVLLCCVSTAAAAADERHLYSMADLEALARAERWVELLEHVEDVKPSARGDGWTVLLVQASRAWLERPDVATDPRRAVALSEALLRRHPALSRDKRFVAKRNEVGMKAFRRCFAASHWAEWCEKQFRGFIKQGPPNPELAMTAGRLVRRSMRHHVAVPYFHHAILGSGKSNPKERAKRCADEDLKLALASAISLRPGHNDGQIRLTQELAFGPCWSDLRQTMVNMVATDEHAKKNACRQLLAKGALSGVRKKKCSRAAQSTNSP